MASRALGLDDAADTELAESAPGLPLRRRRCRRLPERCRGGRAHQSIRRARPCSRPGGHGRHLGAADRGRLRRHDEPRRDQVAGRRHRERSLQPANGAGTRTSPPAAPRTTDPVRVPHANPAAGRRRARGGRVGHRRATGGRTATVGTAGDPRRRGARAAAADLSRPRHSVVDGRIRPVGPALRRGRRPDARTPAAIATARRYPGTDDARPQRADGAGRRAGRPLVGGPGEQGALLGRAAQRVLAGRPEAGTAVGRSSTTGLVPPARRPTAPPSASRRPRFPGRRGWSSTSGAARSVRSSGLPGSGPTTGGSTCRSSTRRVTSATTAASSRAPGCTRWDSPCCGGATPRSSTASRTMHVT